MILIAALIVVRMQPDPNRLDLNDRAAQRIENDGLVCFALRHDVQNADTQRPNVGAAGFFFRNAEYAPLFQFIAVLVFVWKYNAHKNSFGEYVLLNLFILKKILFFYFNLSCISSKCTERLFKIGDDVVNVLEPY